jgi:hypothetical protein
MAPISAHARLAAGVETPRERLTRARGDLLPASPWRGALGTALEALSEPSPESIRALSWLHDALVALLPANPRRDSLEQRALRRAATALEDELATHAGHAVRSA